MSWSLVKFASNNKINLAISILIATLAIANLYYNVSLGGYFYHFISDTSAVWGVLLFIVLLAVSSLIGCYFLSRFVGPLAFHTKKSPFVTSLYKIMLISQYVVLALLVIITCQMLFFSEYTVGLFVAVPVISFTVAALIMGYLSIKFFSWYKSNHNFVILICGISFILLSVGLLAVVVIVGGNVLWEKNVKSTIQPLFNNASSPEKREIDSAKESSLWNIVIMPSRAAFILYWVANVLLLRNYSTKIGRAKFWAVVSLPLIGFLILNLIVILSTLVIGTSPFGLLFLTLTRILIVLIMVMSGIFFAIMFLSVGRAMKFAGQAHIQDYLKCSAYGTVIFVLSLTIHLGTLLYPPAVLIPWAFTGMAAYLISFGYYSLAISVSQDLKLRKTIKNFIISESKLFHNIGTAEMQVKIEQQVSKIVKDQREEMDKQTEIKPSLSEEDMKSYLSEVIQELKESRK